VRDDLVAAAVQHGGVLTYRQAIAATSARTLERAARCGLLVRRHPGVYVLSELAQDDGVLDRAALAYAPGHLLSHTTALRAWDISGHHLDPVRHVTGPWSATRLRGDRTLAVHRRRELPAPRRRRGLPCVSPERAVVESWPMLGKSERRGPAISAVGAGRTTPDRLLGELAAMPTASGSAEMHGLFRLLSAGCRSELEIWGHSGVFDDATLPAAELQFPVLVDDQRFFLDRAYLVQRVDVELDGAAWHGSREQRERDLRRDALLATVGWLVLRFSHAQLHRQPAACRKQLVAVLRSRGWRTAV
jgi:hypothetical protein